MFQNRIDKLLCIIMGKNLRPLNEYLNHVHFFTALKTL